MKRHLIGVAAATLGTLLMGGVVVQTASAADPILETTVTLPLFGAQLTLDIVNGPGGSLTSVEVTPAAGNVATKLRPHKVVFESANLTDPLGDPAKVVIKSRNGTQKISAKAGSLADLTGDGSWVGDVFGDGTLTTVPYSIGGTDAAPTITLGAITGLPGVPGPVQTSSGDDDDDDEASARVSILFTNAAGDQTRSLTIKVKVENDDDDDDDGDDDGSEAKLTITLGKIKMARGAEALGEHTWTGLLCDGSIGSIVYNVAADGALTLGAITTGATSSVDDGKATVTFAAGERVSIKVSSDDDELRIKVKERIRCDSDDPTTNVSTTVDDDDDDDGHDGDHRGHGGDDDDDDDGTSTTDVTTTTSA